MGSINSDEFTARLTCANQPPCQSAVIPPLSRKAIRSGPYIKITKKNDYIENTKVMQKGSEDPLWSIFHDSTQFAHPTLHPLQRQSVEKICLRRKQPH